MSSIKKNFLYNVIYQLLLIILPLITTPYISRVLGADGIGIYTYSYTVANYFMLLAMLGVKNYGNRSIAAVRDNRQILSQTFWEIYGLQFWCSAIALAAYFAFVFLFEADYPAIAVIQGIYVFSGMIDISWLFFGLEQFRITVVRNIAIRLGALTLVFLLVKSADHLWVYTLIMTGSVLISQGYLWLYIRRFVDWQRPKLAGLWKHLRPELVLFIPVIAVSLYKMMDKIMLKQLSDFTQVGYYESVDRIISIPTGIITALGVVMLPRMANLAAKAQSEKSRQYIANSLLFAMFLASGMAFGLAGISENLIPLFLGEGYLPCISLLQAIAPTILFIAWANVLRTQYLIPNHLDRSYIISVSLGAGVNLILNALLIPHLSAMGAVIGTICAEASVCLSQTFMVRKQLEIRRYLLSTLPFLLLGGGMYLLILGLNHLPFGPVLTIAAQILVGGSVYTLASGLYLVRFQHISIRNLFPKHRKKGDVQK